MYCTNYCQWSFCVCKHGNGAEDSIDELIRGSHKNISISPNRKYIAYQDESLDNYGHGSRTLKIIDESGKIAGEFVATEEESIGNVEWSTNNQVFFIYSFSSTEGFGGK